MIYNSYKLGGWKEDSGECRLRLVLFITWKPLTLRGFRGLKDDFVSGAQYQKEGDFRSWETPSSPPASAESSRFGPQPLNWPSTPSLEIFSISILCYCKACSHFLPSSKLNPFIVSTLSDCWLSADRFCRLGHSFKCHSWLRSGWCC